MARVFWAEDNELDRELITEALRCVTDAPEVEFFEDGVELIDRLGQDRPDLVVLDIKMPRMSGLQALERIRRLPEGGTLGVMVFSSASRPEEIAACQRLGALECLQKPVDFNGFADAVHIVTQRTRTIDA